MKNIKLLVWCLLVSFCVHATPPTPPLSPDNHQTPKKYRPSDKNDTEKQSSSEKREGEIGFLFLWMLNNY